MLHALWRRHTSLEHFPTAVASLSIGRVRPGIFDVYVLSTQD
jgi:hypothetical protein